MPLNLSQKKDLVKEMTTVLSDAEVVLTADYSGLTSNELNELRKTTREAGVFVKLVKNNMLKMALKESQFSSMSENVSGPQIVAVGKEDAGKFAKSIKEFIDKKISMHDLKLNIAIKTRQYAKRQRTWSRGQMSDWQKFDPEALLKFIKKL